MNENNNKNTDYIGVYDNKESDTFRPTMESRVHLGYPVSKTLTTKDDSCCVIVNEAHTHTHRSNVIRCELGSSRLWRSVN